MAVNTLISVEAAAELMDAAFVDCRFNLGDPSAGEKAYGEHHIPGAVYAHLDRDLSGDIVPGVTGRHPLPTTESLIATIQQFGISNQQAVVAYDGGNGAFASRLWWLLRSLGHEQVWVLDGGYKAWCTAEQPTSAHTAPIVPSTFERGESLCLSIHAEEVMSTKHKLIDARDEARFLGQVEPIDPVAGHIPGATCLPFVNNVNPDDTFKSPELLKSQFTAAGVSDDQPSVCYCGSGVTACHNILALRHAGYPEPYLYPGSWSEWITNPDRPIETA